MKILRIFTLAILLYLRFASGASDLPNLAEQVRWDFKPVGQAQVFPVYSNSILRLQLPNEVPCCSGTYTATIHTPNYGQQTIGISLPFVGGLKSVRLNGRQISLGTAKWPVPIVPIPIDISSSKSLFMEVDIESPDTRYAGFQLTVPEVGPINQLLSNRDAWIIHQIALPLFLATIIFAMSGALVWMASKLDNPQPLLREYIFTLTVWSLFFIFLSGYIRNVFPLFGAVLHLPVRSIAGMASCRLVMTAVSTSPKNIRRVSNPLLLLSLLSISFGFSRGGHFQVYVYTITNLAFCGTIFELAKYPRKKTFHWALLITGLVAAAGYVSDNIKILTAGPYPVPYLNRYSTPPFLLTALIFVAQELISAIQLSSRRSAVREIIEQVVHDVRSPLSALRLLAKHGTYVDPTHRELLELGISRIAGITESLELSTNETTPDLVTDIDDSIRRVLLEKSVEYPGRPIHLKSNVDPKMAKVAPSNFERTLSNLINNAFESYADSNGEVEVKVSDFKNHWSIEIRDEGKGIGVEQLGKITSRGYSTGKDKGSGLGLWSAKQMCAESGGKLTVSSHPSLGTVITLTLLKS